MFFSAADFFFIFFQIMCTNFSLERYDNIALFIFL